MRNLGTKKVRVGSVSLLFTVIVICVVVLSILSISTVRGDQALSMQTAQSVSDWYDLQNEGQQWLAKVDGVLQKYRWTESDPYLPKGTQRDESVISTVVEKDGRTLQIALEYLGKRAGAPRYRIIKWKASVDWHEDQSLHLFQ